MSLRLLEISLQYLPDALQIVRLNRTLSYHLLFDFFPLIHFPEPSLLHVLTRKHLIKLSEPYPFRFNLRFFSWILRTTTMLLLLDIQRTERRANLFVTGMARVRRKREEDVGVVKV